MASKTLGNLTAAAALTGTEQVYVVQSSNSRRTTAQDVADLGTSQDNMTDGTTNKNYTATEQTKLAGIETGADVTDATNVDAAGATMNTDTDVSGNSWVIDDDTMATATAATVPTSESTKAYADTKIATAATDASGFGFVLDEDDMASDSATKLPTQQSVNQGKLQKVATRTALKALDGSKHLAVYLMESGREGVFKWDSSDLSAEVTVDTEEGVYVAPTSDATGASGAWVREYRVLVPEFFGASASGTRSANKTALQAAINFATAYVGELFLPALYSTDGPLTVANNLRIQGVNPKWSGVTCNSGHAISLVPSTSASDNNTWYGFFNFSSISTSGSPSYGISYLPTDDEYLSNWEMEGCYVSGASMGANFDCRGSTIGIFSCTIRRNWFDNGLRIFDGGDSITVAENTVNGDNGIIVNTLKTGARQLTIRNNNCSALAECIYLISVTGAVIDGNWAETPTYLGDYAGATGALVCLSGCTNIRLYRNTINPLDETVGFTGANYAIALVGTGSNHIIDDNDISDGQLGHIQLDNTTVTIGERNRLGSGETSLAITVTSGGSTLRNYWAPPRCSVSPSANQTGIATATWTKVTLNTETQDVGAFFDNATNYRWTPPKGRIAISATVRFSAGIMDQGTYACAIYKNGSIFQCGNFVHSSGTGVIDPAVMLYDDANGTDYYELWAQGTSSTTLTILGGSSIFTYLKGQWLGAVN